VAAVLAVPAAAVAALRPAVAAPALPGIGVGLAVDGLASVGIWTLVAVLVAVAVFGLPGGAAPNAEPSGGGESGGDSDAGPGSGGPRPRSRTRSHARYYGLLLVFAAAMLATVTAADLLTLLMAWEVMGAASYGLIAFHWREPRTGSSAAVSFLTTRTADLGIYAAAGAALAGGAPGLELDELAGLTAPWSHVAAAGLLAAALGKSAQLPFAFWLSRAMDGPSPVSALLHSATMVAAGGYLLLRVQPALAATGWAGPAAAWAGALTALVMGAVACCQRDLKQLLAASTSAQLGFVVLAAGAGGVAGGAAQFAAHAAVKSLLFLVAGAWLVSLGTTGLGGLRGAARRHRLAGGCFTVGALALGGIPPLSVWAAKDLVLAAAPGVALHVAGYAAAALAAGYAGVALAVVWSRPAPDSAARSTGAGRGTAAATSAADTAAGTAAFRAARPIGLRESLPLPALAAAAAALGALALPEAGHRWAALLGHPAAPAPGPPAAAVSALVAVGVLGAVVLVRRREPAPAPARRWWIRWPRGWLGLEQAARSTVAAPVLAAAGALAAFDDRVLDRGITGAATWVPRFAGVLGDRVEPVVEAVVAALASGARALGAQAHRPQTGLVHQYYAQSAAVLAAAAVVVAVLAAVG
ncbi:proton-conducting transporter transmembrane domain-containing protein, partial [Streptomonospora sediminis]